MKFHLFYALGWNHCCSYRFLGPKWVKVAGRALKIKKINNFTKTRNFRKYWQLVKFMKFTGFLDFGLKNVPQAFVLAVFGASGENVRIIMIFLILLWKIIILMMKNEKIRKNMKIMFSVKVLTGVGTEKVENINNSWKSVIFLKTLNFLKFSKF